MDSLKWEIQDTFSASVIAFIFLKKEFEIKVNSNDYKDLSRQLIKDFKSLLSGNEIYLGMKKN